MKRIRKAIAMANGGLTAHKNLLKPARGVFRRIAAGTADWVRACADHYAAAGLYERLSRLSDTELHRRGLSRDALAKNIFDSIEQKHRSLAPFSNSVLDTTAVFIETWRIQ